MASYYTIKALRLTVDDGETERVLFVGYLPASQLHELAGVPSYEEGTDHRSIALDALNKPTKKWQRPEYDQKVKEIKERYNEPGELMPNPVLLAVRKDEAVKRTNTVRGTTSEVWQIKVDRPKAREIKPLWILDGQHRISGLNKSIQRDNPIPLVLLDSDDVGEAELAAYAKIFTEVSTLASPLPALHSEWLRFAFKIPPYGQSSHHQAMKAVALLCSVVELKTSRNPKVKNPYLDRIQFNPFLGSGNRREKKPDPAIRNGFAFSAIQLKDYFYTHYYNKSPIAPARRMLRERELAGQVADATNSLVSLMAVPDDSVFLGMDNRAHPYLYQAFVKGVLERVVAYHDTDWADLLQKLNFHTTDWKYDLKQDGTTGRLGTASRVVSERVLIEAFMTAALPVGATDLVDCLMGTGWWIELTATDLSGVKDEITKTLDADEIDESFTATWSLDGRDHLQITDHSKNIHTKIPVTPDDSSETLDEHRTMTRSPHEVTLQSKDYAFVFELNHYGGWLNKITLKTEP